MISGLRALFLDEEGSIIVEAGLVMPIVLVVLLILMTLVIVVHDVYVSDVAGQIIVNNQARHVTTSKDLEENLNRTIDQVSFIKTEGVLVTCEDDILTVKRNLSFPLLSREKSVKDSYRVSQSTKFDEVRMVELGMDMIEAVNISDDIRHNFGSGIKTLKTILKNN